MWSAEIRAEKLAEFMAALISVRQVLDLGLSVPAARADIAMLNKPLRERLCAAADALQDHAAGAAHLALSVRNRRFGAVSHEQL